MQSRCAPLLLCLVLAGSPALMAVQRGPDVRPLETAKPIPRELTGSEAHRYSLALKANQFIHLIVDQRGIDVVVALFDPAGTKVTEVDSPNGTSGPEPLFAIGKEPGTYAIEVRSLEPDAKPGRYEIKLAELRTATAQDAHRVDGERALLAASLLVSEGTAASNRAAIARYEEAIKAFGAAGSRQREALTLHLLGETVGALGDQPAALGYFTRGLDVSRSIGDRAGEAVALSNMGSAQSAIGDKRKALESFAQAQEARRGLSDRSGEAATLNNMGAAYDDIGERDKAITSYQQAIAIYESLEDRSSVAIALSNLGFVYLRTNDHARALEAFEKVLPLFRSLGDRRNEARMLNNIGGVYVGTGERTRTLEYWKQALVLYREVGDRSGEGTMLGNLGAVSRDLGDNANAMDYYQQALALHRALKNRGSEGVVLSNIGLLQLALGDPQQALESLTQSLALRRAVSDSRGEATTLNNIGLVYSELGRRPEALEYYNQALQMARAMGNRSGEASLLANMGVIHGDLGDRQKAFDLLEQALDLRRTIGEKPGIAGALGNIGILYAKLGEHRKALDYYEEALALARAVGDKREEAATLSSIGQMRSALGDKTDALALFDQTLAMFRALGDRRNEAETLTNLASLQHSLGDRQRALDLYGQAVALHRAVGDRGNEATTLNNTGIVYDALGDRARAEEYYKQALVLHRAVQNPDGEASVLYNLASASRDAGRPLDALALVGQMRAITNSLRSKLGSQHLRASYFSTIRKHYEFEVHLLMDLHAQAPAAGYLDLALQASEQMRARTLLETLTEASADIRQGVDRSLIERERSLLQQLDVRAQQQTRLLNGPHTPAQAALAAKAIDELTTSLRQNEAAIRNASPRYAALTQPQPLTLAEMQRALDADTLLLEYTLGRERSYLFAVTRDASAGYMLPAGQTIEDLARRYYDAITARNRRPAGESAQAWRTRIAAADRDLPALAASLSRMILGPVRAQLAGKRLLIVPAGALQQVPFASLPLPTTAGTSRAMLVERHDVAVLPSLAAVALQRQVAQGRPTASKSVAVLADPVFSAADSRLTQAVERTPQPSSPPRGEREGVLRAADAAGVADEDGALPRLRYSRDEAEAILALSPANARLSALDFDATVGLVTGGMLADYRILHIASHAFLNGDNAELSGVALSMVDAQGRPIDGFLRLGSIFNLQLPIEMVVLSACQTALGKDAGGEGLVGLARAFMYAGVPRVIGSLWKVDDQATAQLMTLFYRQLLGSRKVSAAAALRAAQAQLRQIPRWNSPHYWAGFVLEGEWR